MGENTKQLLPRYPIKFKPIFKEKIWGGTKLKKYLNKQVKGNIGESWELSGVDENVSIVQNGTLKGKDLNSLIIDFKEDLVGKKVYRSFHNTFPLLFKFIDAREDLSVQLHPNDKLAKERHNSFGKSEMWYVLQADENSRLILGFRSGVEETNYKIHLKENTLSEILHYEKVDKGDSFFIDTGTVHAIGAGVVLAEIQQTSDITYRIYDYNRPDTNGNLRTLHNDLALEALDFKKVSSKLVYESTMNEPVQICKTNYFETNKIILIKDIKRDLSAIDSFVVYMCVEGMIKIEFNDYSEIIMMGETVLIPAIIDELKIISNSATILEVFIP